MNGTNQNQSLGKSELRYYFIRLTNCFLWKSCTLLDMSVKQQSSSGNIRTLVSKCNMKHRVLFHNNFQSKSLESPQSGPLSTPFMDFYAGQLLPNLYTSYDVLALNLSLFGLQKAEWTRKYFFVQIKKKYWANLQTQIATYRLRGTKRHLDSWQPYNI